MVVELVWVMTNGQIRLNKATREWVIYSPTRRKRPQDFQDEIPAKPAVNHEAEKCPFCPGKQHELEDIILELPNPSNNAWQTRVIANKFPALTPLHKPKRVKEGIYLTLPGYGNHEVIIESPRHYDDLATMPLADVEIVIETYYQRYLALMADPDTMFAIIFRNHGKRAGASLKHPHSQIISTGIVPHNRRWQEEEAQRYFDKWGSCVYCDILAFEQQERTRVVAENDSFLAFVPFAAEVPCEMWIMPKEHQADFGSITAEEKSDFAQILQTLLEKLYTKLNNPDYNYIINTAARYKAEEPQVHWYCKIEPRLTTLAGFEIGSGISINPSLPELDAEFLLD